MANLLNWSGQTYNKRRYGTGYTPLIGRLSAGRPWERQNNSDAMTAGRSSVISGDRLESSGLNNNIGFNLQRQADARAKAQQEANKQTEIANQAQLTANNADTNSTDQGWKTYFNEEKQKVRDQAFKNDQFGSWLQDVFNAGWDNRLAETQARNRYNTEMMNRAWDNDGNVVDENAANLVKNNVAGAIDVARRNQGQEQANSRAIGASYDSDYYTGFDWDSTKNRSHSNDLGNALAKLGTQFAATANAVRKMDVGNAMFNDADPDSFDWTDVGRFVANLLPGMANAPTTGLTNTLEAISGRGLDENTGKVKELDTLERFGRGASGAVDAAGVFFGGSGDLLSAVGNRLFKKGATEATKQAVKNATTSTIKGFVKAMLEEGAEEGVQQMFDFFGNGGKLVTEDGQFDAESFKQMLGESAQAAALGAVGGGIFHAAGEGINALQGARSHDLPVEFETTSEQNRRFDKEIRQYYKKYGDDFYEKMPSLLQERYDELLDAQPRDANGVYSDPITGGQTIDQETGMKDRFGNTFSEENIPVSKLKRSQEFQPRTTASGRGTSDSVFKFGYNEGRVDQPMLVRKMSDGTYEVLGGHSRTEGLERRAEAGLPNPETVKARVYENITDKQALQISQAANQGGQYESIIDMAKSISDARNAGIEPSVQKQNLVKGFTMDDYESLHKILSGDRNLQDHVFAGAISQEDMLSIARTARRLNFDPERTRNLVRTAYERGNFNRRGIEAVMKSLSTKQKNADYDASVASLFDMTDYGSALDSQDEILQAEKELRTKKTLENSLDRVTKGLESFTEEQRAALRDALAKLSPIESEKITENSKAKEDTGDGANVIADASNTDVARQIMESWGKNQQSAQVASSTEPLSYAEDGTPEFVKRYTKRKTLDGEDNSRYARKARLKQFMENLKDDENPIVRKFYELWHGDRTKSVVASLNSDLLRRYVAEGGVPLSDGANFVMKDNFIRHLDNDGHLTGIWREPDKKTGIQIDANPLTKNDLAMLDGILKDPDTIGYAGNGSRGGKKLRIEKQVGDNMRVIAEVLNDGKDLELVSYFKINKTPLEGALPTSGKSGLPRMEGQANPARGTTNTAVSAESTSNLTSSIADNMENVNQAGETSRNYETESESLPDDFDVAHYVTDQVEAQQKRSRLPLRERIADVTAELKHYLVDDAVAYERYIKDKNERLNIREGVDRVRSSDMIAWQWVRDHGLEEIRGMPDAEMNEFQQYLIAKRALEVEAQGKKTGRSKAADQALIDHVGNKYARQEAIIRQYTRDMLEYSAENGLISQKLKDKLLAENPNYVPINRVFDAIEERTGFKSKQLGNLSGQSVVQKLTGSERTIDNPIDSIMRNTLRMINEVERNKTAELIVKSEAFHEKRLADGQKPRPGYDTIDYMVDGKKVSYEVPKLVAQEMKNLNNVLPRSAELVLRFAGAPTKLLRGGATQNNPIFALSNLVRDQMQTLVTGNISANLRGTKDAMVATFSPTKRGKELRAELNRAGIIGNEYRQTYGYAPNELVKQLQNSSRLDRRAIERIKHPINALGDLIGRTEYFTRAQQYFGTEGDTTTKAQAARNNTLNFSRAGATVRILNRVIPFLNASVQGGRATFNSLKNRPVHTTLTMASFAGIALAARGAAEAQDKELWDRIDDSDKGQNIIVFTPDAHYNSETNRVEGIIKIPMPQMLYPIMDATNNMRGQASDFSMLAGDIFTAITGLESPNEEQGVLPVVNQLTPTAVKPFVEMAMNRSSYTGNDLVSDYDSNKNPEDKGAKYTTGLARSISAATGIDAPIVDNFIQNWGGGLAKDLSKNLTDNPDNKSDGGGLGAMFGNGFERRFLSGTLVSQYDIADGLAKNYKESVKNEDSFKALTSAEQQKVLNAIDNDMNSIAGMAAKVEQGRTEDIGSDTLSQRQTEIVNNGFDANSYISAVLDKSIAYTGNGSDSGISTLSGDLSDYGKTTTTNRGIKINDGLASSDKDILRMYNSMSSDDWNQRLYENSLDGAAAEYNLAKAKYNNDVANGALNEAQKVRRQEELAKLEASQRWTKDYRDIYTLANSRTDMQAYLGGLDDATRSTTMGILNGLNRAMYDAGVINAATYKSRANAINNTSSTSGGAKYGGITSGEASAMASLARAMASTPTNTTMSSSAPTASRRTRGAKRSSVRKYTPSVAKNATVTKNKKRNIA